MKLLRRLGFRLLTVVAFSMLLGLPACVGAPHYQGGPRGNEPHAVVSLVERVSLWKIDGKSAWNRSGDTFLSPGVHKLKVRVEYTVEYDGEGNFEWHDVELDAKEGGHYLLTFRPSALDGTDRTLDLPPYRIVVDETSVRGGR